MKKKALSFMAVMFLTLSVCMTAFAEEETSTETVTRDGTAAELKSYGAIVYQKGLDSVKIDSEDLYMLADQIDQVKLQVTDQLEAMNTYFTAGEGEISLETSNDISVVHAKPFEEDSVDPLGVNFDTLLEGIAVSQSVSSDAAAYGYPAGTELYKMTNGLLTTNPGSGTEKINVAAANADNLSAGTAAWVNGSLILGTGGDNKSYHDSGRKGGYDEGYNVGYNAGYEKGLAASAGKSYSNGNVVNNGGYTKSYTVPTDMKDVIIYYYGRPDVNPDFSPAVQYRVLVDMGHSIDSGRNCRLIYITELKAGTVINYSGLQMQLFYQ